MYMGLHGRGTRTLSAGAAEDAACDSAKKQRATEHDESTEHDKSAILLRSASDSGSVRLSCAAAALVVTLEPVLDGLEGAFPVKDVTLPNLELVVDLLERVSRLSEDSLAALRRGELTCATLADHTDAAALAASFDLQPAAELLRDTALLDCPVVVELLALRVASFMQLCDGPDELRTLLCAPDDLSSEAKQVALSEPLLTCPSADAKALFKPDTEARADASPGAPSVARSVSVALDAGLPIEGNAESCLAKVCATTLRSLKAVSVRWAERARQALGDPTSSWRRAPVWLPPGTRATDASASRFVVDPLDALRELCALDRSVALPAIALDLLELLASNGPHHFPGLWLLCCLEPLTLSLHLAAIVKLLDNTSMQARSAAARLLNQLSLSSLESYEASAERRCLPRIASTQPGRFDVGLQVLAFDEEFHMWKHAVITLGLPPKPFDGSEGAGASGEGGRDGGGDGAADGGDALPSSSTAFDQGPPQLGITMNTSGGDDQLVKLDADRVVSTSGIGVLLVKAAQAGRADLVEALIRSGARINDADLDATTALHAAAESGHLAICERLIRRRANPNMINRKHRTALDMVLAGHSIALDSNGIALLDMLQPSNTVLSALDTAAKFGDAATVRLLVCAAADVTVANGDGMTALHYAATYGHTDVVKMLCDATTSIEQESAFGETPLMCAARHDRVAMVQLLLRRGANANTASTKHSDRPGALPIQGVCKLGMTALHVAGSREVTELLLQAGADHSHCSEGQTISPMHVAGPEQVRTLVAAGAEVDVPRIEDGTTPLHLACYSGNVALVRTLLELGASIQRQSTTGISGLAFAAFNGQEAVIRLLLQQVAVWTITQLHGAADIATNFGHHSIAFLLRAPIEQRELLLSLV
jgi:ankyrin repeat protein